jgi:allantoicase
MIQDNEGLEKFVNLASPRLGTVVEAASDDFFGEKSRLIQDSEPVFVPGKYDVNGKWMDGWETRRRRGLGHDWCLVRLGVPGVLSAIDLDTRHFTGNYPPAASVEGSADDRPDASARWRTLVPTSPLGPNARHLFPVADAEPVKWLRLSIYPDGGVARLRAYGAAVFDPTTLPSGGEVELSAVKYGGRVLGYSDAHYGDPWVILTDGRGRDMGDGWETRRRREPGHDWMVIALGVPGTIARLEIDTAHFKGNFPDKVSVQACRVDAGTDRSIICQSMFWPDLMSPRNVEADTIHMFGTEHLATLDRVTHVRLNIHPDGGISRFRAFGHPGL